MPQPKSIRIFLAEGTPKGLTIATVPNWSGFIIKGRNSDLPTLMGRTEIERPGVYILLGEDPTQDIKERCYIGQTSNLKKRIAQHTNDKNWWEEVFVISTTDSNFGSGHFLSLEAKLIIQAEVAQKVALENSQTPSDNAGNLGEADNADVINFLSEVALVLPVLGSNLLRQTPKTKIENTQENNENSRENFELTNNGKKLADAYEIDGDFFVCEGSLALKEPGHAANSYKHHREKLISVGTLKDIGEYFEFSQDIEFSSPSKAAAIILDRNANGRTEWKIAGTKKTYSDWQFDLSGLTLESLGL